MTELDDPEFKSWSDDAKYIFQERLGMSCNSTPFDQCPLEAVESARRAAREFENERILEI